MAEDKTPNAISWLITPACADFLVSCADPRLIIFDAPDATVDVLIGMVARRKIWTHPKKPSQANTSSPDTPPREER